MAITKLWIEEGCTVCNLCEDTAPEVFEVTDERPSTDFELWYSEDEGETGANDLSPILRFHPYQLRFIRSNPRFPGAPFLRFIFSCCLSDSPFPRFSVSSLGVYTEKFFRYH